MGIFLLWFANIVPMGDCCQVGIVCGKLFSIEPCYPFEISQVISILADPPGQSKFIEDHISRPAWDWVMH